MSTWSTQAQAAPATIVVADSVAEFSSVQGQDGWYYGYYTGAPSSPDDFIPMTEYDPIEQAWKVDDSLPAPVYWTMLDRFGGHPNGSYTSSGRTPAEHRAARRYVSEVAGLVTIAGELADRDPYPGTLGARGHIHVDGVQRFITNLPDGSLPIGYSIEADVHVGSIIDIVINPAADDYADLTRFTAVITTIAPEPTQLGLLASAAATLLLRRRTPRKSRERQSTLIFANDGSRGDYRPQR
ncbi:PEP-CTERM sorting domain-containing protein [Posidoniimonas polymericola]|uniref:PEP-CTERM sorting domain-containing protein n=1 Tax=Posidoniimonas polymericola TaxID=2528002 RepID=UPI0018D4AD3D|nr:PEP-CTERM sorting domain-containing protein [Posidoniimonas polymericola]